MISFRMSEEEEQFLKSYAKEHSLNLSMFMKKAIFEKIEDIEDYKVAEKIAKKIAKDVRSGKEQITSFDDFLMEMDADV